VDIEYIVLLLGIIAIASERSYRLYLKFKDGKIDLDDLQEIVSEATDIIEDTKEEIESAKEATEDGA
tara:strand:+ start:299 stop:499 length:201 start_codon:yes stop_codon:yes gene_type:complete